MKKRFFILAMTAALSSVALSGCQVVRGESSLAQYSSDSQITTAVKLKLAQSDQVSATRVHVETESGTVLLSGFAQDMHQKRIAGRLAKSVEGVKAVKNQIVIN